MTNFPDDRGLPRSSDGAEPILGGSVALNRVLIMLREQAFIPNRIRWSGMIISAFTIFRNIYTKDTPMLDLVEKFRLDTDLLQLYLDAYQTVSGSPPHPTPIVIYVPNYEALPTAVLRDQNKTQDDLTKKFKDFIRTFPPGETQINDNPGTSLWSVTVGSASMLPHVTLAQWLQTKALRSVNFGYTYGAPLMIISHCPVDLHIQKRLPKTYLVESYQGIIRTPREFGRKLVGCDETIPFTTATHRAFGDAVHIAPLVTREQKKQLLEMAIKKKWVQQPAESVMRDISAVTKISISELSKLQL